MKGCLKEKQLHENPLFHSVLEVKLLCTQSKEPRSVVKGARIRMDKNG